MSLSGTQSEDSSMKTMTANTSMEQMKDWATVIEKQEQEVTESDNPFDQFPS